MDFILALRLTEILLAFAFIQSSIEHIVSNEDERRLVLPRIILCFLLLFGVANSIICLFLFLHSLIMLHYFKGPYNGGSDRMGILICFSLTLAHYLPEGLNHVAFAYLAIQTILSYFLPGFFKALNKNWWSGKALRDIFELSSFPVTKKIRNLAQNSKLMFIASWVTLFFQLLFPLALINQVSIIFALSLAFIFHIANSYLFGFNRFIWIWLAAYPSILWLQAHSKALLF